MRRATGRGRQRAPFFTGNPPRHNCPTEERLRPTRAEERLSLLTCETGNAWLFGIISFGLSGGSSTALSAPPPAPAPPSFQNNPPLVSPAFCCRLTGLFASKFVHVNRKCIRTALGTVCLCSKYGFLSWRANYGLLRPTVPGSSAREMLVKVPSSSSTSASIAEVFSLSSVFCWVSDAHSPMSQMSKMSHSSHHSLLFFLTFLLSHSLTPAA